MTLEEFQKQIGIEFKNQNLLKQALVHRSFLNEDRTVTASNERLEFLGDAVLSFLTSHYLYDTYPEYPEGILTNIRSSLVKTSTLAGIAGKLGIGQLLFLSHGEEESGGRTNQSLLADAFEAVLGAIYLDLGIDCAKTYLATHLFPMARDLVAKKAYIDFKSYLQEIVQETTKISPQYRVTRSEGPDHNKTFWMEVVSNGVVLGSGSGKSKQAAEQEAARNALEKMGKT